MSQGLPRYPYGGGIIKAETNWRGSENSGRGLCFRRCVFQNGDRNVRGLGKGGEGGMGGK